MRKISIYTYGTLSVTVLCFVVLLIGGCAELAKIGHVMQQTGEVGSAVGGSIPVYGTIVTAVSALLAIAGGGIATIANKRLKASRALIEGVSYAYANKADIKAAISTIAGKSDIWNYLDKLVQEFDPPTKTVNIKT